MFRDNNKELGVMNGTLGRIKNMDGSSFHVTLDNGKDISFDAKEYTKFQHGYATTVHKAQGVTVDETYVLASQHFRTLDHMKQSLPNNYKKRCRGI
jgi:ATP-dependent exoDNAse (exonuclease V) alpha subunit